MGFRLFFCAWFLLPLFCLSKYQVCSVTINSSDEIETFRANLSQDEFEFVELLPSAVNAEQNQSAHWFDSACKKTYKCDVLVISGHFGGTFFGKSGYTLPTELMEAKSCQKSCPGILSEVKEIFLFGCNTLASKTKDHRTYTEYLQVLLDDGMDREAAERVVAARYSPLETPFYTRMNFIFSGSHTVYGFDQLSPLGQYIKKPLNRYFKAINNKFGSYGNYLKNKGYKRTENHELFEQLPRNDFSFSQASISAASEKLDQQQFFRDKCLLYDEKQSFSARIEALSSIFSSGKSGSAFFAIDHFLNSKKKEIQEGQGRYIFRKIKNNRALMQEFLSYYKHLHYLPYIKMIYLNLLEKFHWVDPFELHILRKESLIQVIKTPDQEAYISVLFLLRQKQISPSQMYISKKDLPEDYMKNIWALLIFEKLRAIAPEWQEDILDFCRNNLANTPGLCYQSLNTLAHIGTNSEIAKDIVEYLDRDQVDLVYFSLRALGQSGTQDYSIHRKIANFLKSSNASLRQEAIEALGFLKSSYSDIQTDLASLLKKSSDGLVEEILWSLNEMDITSVEAQAIIFDYLKTPNLKSEFFIKAFHVFELSSEFSDSTLFFFYEILENRENTALLFPTIELLSKNRNIKDLGIHYRFLIFQSEESLVLKRQALKSMRGLTWLHPELQINFLNYFRDSDREVRELSAQVLRDVTNLTEKTQAKMRLMYQTERILELRDFVIRGSQ